MTEDLTWTEYDFESVAPERSITLSFDINSCEIELALATNGASLRQASLLALLAALSSTNRDVPIKRAAFLD
jgi:hypothetical protein